MAESREALLEKSFELRTEAWSKWGEVEPDVLTHLISPTFMGGPRWPAMRQAFRVVRRPGSVLVASDGLSDPFDEDEGPEDLNGVGLEFFAFTGDGLDQIPGSWLFDLVWQMSQLGASHGGIAGLLDEMKLVSTELHDVGIPDEHAGRFVNEAGRVAVLVGMDARPIPAQIEGPLSPIKLVNLKLLTLEELDFVLERGAEGRAELAERFAATGEDALGSSLRRASMV